MLAQKIERLTFSKGKLNIAEFVSKPEHPVVHVDLQDVGLSLTVRFKRFHLDIVWNKVDKQPKDTHGLIGKNLMVHFMLCMYENQPMFKYNYAIYIELSCQCQCDNTQLYKCRNVHGCIIFLIMHLNIYRSVLPRRD